LKVIGEMSLTEASEILKKSRKLAAEVEDRKDKTKQENEALIAKSRALLAMHARDEVSKQLFHALPQGHGSGLDADMVDGLHAFELIAKGQSAGGGGGGAGSAHDLLSALHGDTLIAAVQAGDIIFGNSTPKWARFAKGSQYYVLVMGAADPSWALITNDNIDGSAAIAESKLALNYPTHAAAHTLASHSSKAHSELTGVGENDHHTKFTTVEHDTTVRHTLGTVVPHDALASLTEKSHVSLTDKGTNTHAQLDTHLAAAAPHSGHEQTANKDQANGYAGLSAGSKLAVGQMPTGKVKTTLSFAVTGTLVVGTDKAPTLLAPCSLTITKVKLVVKTAPTGQAIIVDVNKNGTTIFTTQGNRPQIAAGATTGDSGTPDVTSLAEGDKLTVDIDQIGSGTAGADLTVEVVGDQSVVFS
jgi:hypothetical protein